MSYDPNVSARLYKAAQPEMLANGREALRVTVAKDDLKAVLGELSRLRTLERRGAFRERLLDQEVTDA